MPSYQISLTPTKRAAGRFIAMVRREIQMALAEEHAENGTTQASIATALDVNRSVIHRQIMGYENLTLGTVGEIACALGREPSFSLVRPEVIGSNHVACAAPTAQSLQSPVSGTPARDFAYGAGVLQNPALAG